ncbi:cytochrome c oxidase assembly protein [Catenuloplanes atrovinosus]|uniref:Copper resistance protein D n=1 Tax=Catenuloplanes atrovinosus TaxID=137266 RepID=A0AAE3YQ18_9ACTN|nr:cytochrome c oxidase assembly protein [Catenuloplanes atrovinosus]MDR7276481.1 putative copper resistance protein D [Catenuloplanes atrovinosus]
MTWNGYVVATAAGVAVSALGLALWQGGGADTTEIVGLAQPGAATVWGLPALRLLSDALATVTAGLVVTGAFVLPGEGRAISATAFRMVRRARWTAALWSLTALALIAFTLSDVLGAPLHRLPPAAVLSFAGSISQGQALLIQAVLAAAVAVLCQVALSRYTAAWAAGVAMVAVLPPAFTGHAAGAGNHQLAVTSLAMHVLGAALWAGGLIALLTVRRNRALPAALARYSHLALICFVAVAVSGVINGAVRLGGDWRTAYGALLAAKLVALLGLGAIGAAHRRAMLRRPAFIRLAAGEVVLFGAAFGLAAALSRSPAPIPDDTVSDDPIVETIGFPMPEPLTAARLLGDPLPDLFFLTVAAVGIGAYLAGVRRLRAPWPVTRTAAWVAGMLLLAAVTGLGLGRYAYVLFSVHMVQHMLLSMAVPILLVLGAPVTLALRTSPGAVREWLLIVLHSRVARALTHPLSALAVYGVSLYGLYFGGLLGLLMRYHLGHLAMLAHFVLAGYLLFWVLIGVDLGRPRVAPPILVLVHFASMVVHAFFGLTLSQSTTLIAPEWYLAVHPPWAAPPLDDQRLGAAIAWAFGEIPAALVMIVLVRQWIRSDEREQRRADRHGDGAHARYNEFLASAARERR